MSSALATDEEPGVCRYTARAMGRRLFQGTWEEFQEWKDRCYQEAALEFEGGDDGASLIHDYGSLGEGQDGGATCPDIPQSPLRETTPAPSTQVSPTLALLTLATTPVLRVRPSIGKALPTDQAQRKGKAGRPPKETPQEVVDQPDSKDSTDEEEIEELEAARLDSLATCSRERSLQKPVPSADDTS